MPWLLLTPWLIGLFFITLGPMLASLYLSFTDYNLLGDTTWVGVNNYVRMFTDDPKFLTAAGVTLNCAQGDCPEMMVRAGSASDGHRLGWLSRLK